MTQKTNMFLNVLMIIEGEIATTQLLERLFIACEPYGLRYRKRLLNELIIHDFDDNTIPVFVRCGDPALEFWIELLDRANHPFLYYIDDNFWKIDGDSALSQYYQHPRIRKSLEYIVSKASLVLTNSEDLLEFLCYFNKSGKVLPTFFDFSLIEKVVADVSSEIRIGFAGSPSRLDDLDIIAPLLEPILSSNPRVVFEFAGVLPRGVTESARVRFFPHSSEYNSFIRFQAERSWSIGLAPLFDNEANRCKTNNKYREYGACRIAGVYSNLELYKRSVVHGLTGVLVTNTTDSWLSAISNLVAIESECHKIGQRAYEDVKEKYCVNHVSGEWYRVFLQATENFSDKTLPLRCVYRRARLRQISLRLKAYQIKLVATFSEGGVLLVLKKILCKWKKLYQTY